jgi:hypothetical protein
MPTSASPSAHPTTQVTLMRPTSGTQTSGQDALMSLVHTTAAACSDTMARCHILHQVRCLHTRASGFFGTGAVMPRRGW